MFTNRKGRLGVGPVMSAAKRGFRGDCFLPRPNGGKPFGLLRPQHDEVAFRPTQLALQSESNDSARGTGASNMPFYQTNPPFCGWICDAMDFARGGYGEELWRISVGSFWKTNPPAGGNKVVNTRFQADKAGVVWYTERPFMEWIHQFVDLFLH